MHQHHHARLLTIIIAIIVGCLCSYAVQQQQQQQQYQKIVLIGGNLKYNEIYNTFVRLSYSNVARNGTHLRIGIITAASDTPEDGAVFYTDQFKSLGVKNVEWVPIDKRHIGNNSNPMVLERISQMTGIFFGGGDQSVLVDCFYNTTTAAASSSTSARKINIINNENDKNQISEKTKRTATSTTTTRVDSPALAMIRAMHMRGELTLAGTSAGMAIMQGAGMVTGGESYPGLKFGASPAVDPTREERLTYDPIGGFNFFTLGLLDTHFSERGRQGRLMRLLTWSDIATKHCRAFAADENTALVYMRNIATNETKMRVEGQGGVYLFDKCPEATTSSRRRRAAQANEEVIVNTMQVSYLTEGDEWNEKFEPQIAYWKTSLNGREENATAITTNDIFSAEGSRKNYREFTRVATALFHSNSTETTGNTFEHDPTYTVVMRKAAGASEGFEGSLFGKSFTSFVKLDVTIYKV